MKVLKSRDGATGTEFAWSFAPRTLAMVPYSDPLTSRILEEREYANNSHSWEQVIYRYRTGDRTTPFLDREDVERVLNMERPGNGVG
jgi:hypothetical protein